MTTFPFVEQGLLPRGITGGERSKSAAEAGSPAVSGDVVQLDVIVDWEPVAMGLHFDYGTADGTHTRRGVFNRLQIGYLRLLCSDIHKHGFLCLIVYPNDIVGKVIHCSNILLKLG